MTFCVFLPLSWFKSSLLLCLEQSRAPSSSLYLSLGLQTCPAASRGSDGPGEGGCLETELRTPVGRGKAVGMGEGDMGALSTDALNTL